MLSLLRRTSLRFVKLRFVPRDFWIGVYVDSPLRGTYGDTYAAYICIIPMLPIHICWRVDK